MPSIFYRRQDMFRIVYCTKGSTLEKAPIYVCIYLSDLLRRFYNGIMAHEWTSMGRKKIMWKHSLLFLSRRMDEFRIKAVSKRGTYFLFLLSSKIKIAP